MANRRVLVKRRKSIRNIRKITRTMQLIATARFQAAFNRAVASRPYTEKLAELVADLARAGDGLDHPLLKTKNPAAPAAVVVVSSNRGLCGGYNSSILRTALGFLEERRKGAQPSQVSVFGKKGIAYFRFIKQPFEEATAEIADAPRFEQVEPVANSLIQRFLDGEISAVYVTYMRFYSASKQRPETIQLLPLAPTELPAGAKAKNVDYEFRPEPGALLDDLLPAVARIRLFQAFLDSAVSEQIARMVAMKAATEASEEMIKTLSRQYNRARQTQITMELLDIVGGANALA
ncbi:MAG: ATP synthase F1 subunit gamma [Thermoanaerobaculia bacterium]|nr:ATP synthase F1 subunit gamma [Thermoanaerobaculia bacterium]